MNQLTYVTYLNYSLSNVTYLTSDVAKNKNETVNIHVNEFCAPQGRPSKLKRQPSLTADDKLHQ